MVTDKKIDIFVPGRLCLFGEHSDWASGYRTLDPSIAVGHCLTAGTNQGIVALAFRHPDTLIIMSSGMVGSNIIFGCPMNELLLENAKQNGFFCYCAGVAYYIQRKFKVCGLVIENITNIPIKKGLASSAAICVLVARAFNQIYNLGLTIAEEMEIAYQGEILTGSQCGRMDQVCAYGEVPVFLTFDGDDMQVEQLFPQSPLYFVIVDLKVGKDTKRILADLNHHFITGGSFCGRHAPASSLDRADDHNGSRELRDGLRYALGDGNAQILFEAKKAIQKGDAETVGVLMCEAQTMFDRLVAPACPTELAAPKLHQVLAYPPIQELIWGGKGVGSQGDGSAQFVARGFIEQQEIVKRLEKLDVTCLTLTVGKNKANINIFFGKRGDEQ
jgi:galactokinase